MTREEIERYKDEYCPAAIYEFLSYKDDEGKSTYAGALLTVSASHVEGQSNNYSYRDAYVVIATDEGRVSPAIAKGLTEGSELADGISIAGYDLISSYRILSERTDRSGFAKRVVLNTLRHHRKADSLERFYLYLQLNAMLMGITTKNEHQRTQGELVKWYYPRVVRYLTCLDNSEYKDIDRAEYQYIIRPYCC